MKEKYSTGHSLPSAFRSFRSRQEKFTEPGINCTGRTVSALGIRERRAPCGPESQGHRRGVAEDAFYVSFHHKDFPDSMD